MVRGLMDRSLQEMIMETMTTVKKFGRIALIAFSVAVMLHMLSITGVEVRIPQAGRRDSLVVSFSRRVVDTNGLIVSNEKKVSKPESRFDSDSAPVSKWETTGYVSNNQQWETSDYVSDGPQWEVFRRSPDH